VKNSTNSHEDKDGLFSLRETQVLIVATCLGHGEDGVTEEELQEVMSEAAIARGMSAMWGLVFQGLAVPFVDDGEVGWRLTTDDEREKVLRAWGPAKSVEQP
jgi:hypothetical protein